MISVIIPVYNGSEHILTCYQSLLNQTYKDWEAVFVNDGSTDDSQDILEDLSSKDNRVKTIRQDNAGVAIARENGIKASESTYVTFLDVDDKFLPQTLSVFTRGFRDKDVEIVVGGLILTEEENIKEKISYTNKITSGKEFFKNLCTGQIRWQLCAKAFHRDSLLRTSTPAGLIAGEDMAVCMQAALDAKKVLIDENIVYDYVQNTNSVTHSKNIRISIDSIKAAQFVEDYIEKTKTKDNELQIYTDSMFLLSLCSALRNGGETPNMREIMFNHCNLKSLRKIPILKAIVLVIFKLFHLNIFTLIKK